MYAKPSFPRLNRSHPLAQNLVGAWECWEQNGKNLNDVSPYQNVATGQAGVVVGGWGGGPAGACYSATGTSNNFFQATSSSVYDGTQALTVLAIVTNGNTNTGTTPFAKYNNTSSDTGSSWLLTHANTGTAWRFGVCISTLRTDATGGSTTGGANVAQVVVGKYDGANVTLFVDGKQVGQTAATGTINANAIPVSMGARNANASQYNGKLIAFRIWNRVLSDVEIEQVSADPWNMYTQSRRTPLLSAVVGVTSDMWVQPTNQPYFDKTGIVGY